MLMVSKASSDIRAVIVTDFEKTSSSTLVEDVLDKEAGGAVAAYRAVLQSEATDRLDPVLMTGTTVLVDDDLLQNIFPLHQLKVQNLPTQMTNHSLQFQHQFLLFVNPCYQIKPLQL